MNDPPQDAGVQGPIVSSVYESVLGQTWNKRGEFIDDIHETVIDSLISKRPVAPECTISAEGRLLDTALPICSGGCRGSAAAAATTAISNLGDDLGE